MRRFLHILPALVLSVLFFSLVFSQQSLTGMATTQQVTLTAYESTEVQLIELSSRPLTSISLSGNVRGGRATLLLEIEGKRYIIYDNKDVPSLTGMITASVTTDLIDTNEEPRIMLGKSNTIKEVPETGTVKEGLFNKACQETCALEGFRTAKLVLLVAPGAKVEVSEIVVK
jgi:hypothetical protein